jgi:hypothetical protein
LATVVVALTWVGLAQTPVPSFAPLQWSPDGEQLAFVGETADADAVFPADWLFPAASPNAPERPRQRALWVATPKTGEASLILATDHQYSTPAWSPDGSALFIAEFVADGSDDRKSMRGKQRLWRIPRAGEPTVLLEEPATAALDRLAEFPMQGPAISPDGLFAAWPTLDPAGIAVAALADRKIVRRYVGALLPTWSPDGRQLLIFQPPQGASMYSLIGALAPKGSRATALVAVDRGDFAFPDRPATTLNLGAYDPLRPVAWDRSGDAFIAMRSSGDAPTQFDRPRLAAFRCRRSEERAVRVLNLVRGDNPAVGLPAYDFDRIGECVVLSAPRGDGRYLLDRYSIAAGKREFGWHPLDDEQPQAAIPLGAPAVSPDGAMTAFRFGALEPYAAVAVWDSKSESARFLVSDDAGALRAVGPILAAARRTMKSVLPGNFITLKMTLPERWARGRTPYNPFEWLPRPHEPPGMREPVERAVRRLAAVGLSAVATAERGSLSPTAQARLHETAAYFHYLRAEYRAALARLGRLERLRTSAPIARQVGMTIFRAQCQEGLGAARIGRLGLEDSVRRLQRPSVGGGEFQLTPYDREEAWKLWEDNLDPYETRLLELFEPPTSKDSEPVSLPGYEVTKPTGR